MFLKYNISFAITFTFLAFLVHATKDSEDVDDLEQSLNNDIQESPTESSTNKLLFFVKKEYNQPSLSSKNMSIEQAYNYLMDNPMIEKVFKTHKNLHTWKNIKWANGNEKVKYYICHSKSTAINKSPHCNKGYWKQQKVIPSCGFNILSMINSNEVCALAFGGTERTPKKSSFCDEGKQYMMTNIKKICSNKMHAKWYFRKIADNYVNASIPELDILCQNQTSCEIYTTYRIKEDNNKIIFRISDKNKKLLYIRTMYANSTSLVCDESCLYSLENNNENKIDIPKMKTPEAHEKRTAIKEFVSSAKEIVVTHLPESNTEELLDSMEQSGSIEHTSKRLTLPWKYYDRQLL